MIINNNDIDINSLEVKDVIDIDLLQKFQDMFSESMDFASIIVDKNGNQVTKPSSYTRFCNDFIHSTDIGKKRCAKCHKYGGEIAAKTCKPYIYICHAGLIDFAAPILIKGKHIGTILGGQVLTDIPDEAKYKCVAQEIGVDEYKLIESVKNVKIINMKSLNTAAQILFLVSNALSKIGYEELELNYFSKRLEIEVKKKNALLKESKKNNKLKSKLFLTMSHELRTPINIIFSSEQLLENIYKKGTPKYDIQPLFKYLDIMKQNCYRMIKLTNNIIDMSKMEHGFSNINFVYGDIVKAIEDITLSIVDFAKQKNISVTFNTKAEDRTTSYDPEKLERIMLNLLSNAIKYTPAEGNINVSIFNEDGFILVSVKDNGIGIPENMLNKIFNVFIQVDNVLTRKAEGSGIGLSIVKSLAEMQGWKVTAQSELGKGSDFRLKIPIRLIKNKSDIHSNNDENMLADNIKIEFSDIYL